MIICLIFSKSMFIDYPFKSGSAPLDYKTSLNRLFDCIEIYAAITLFSSIDFLRLKRVESSKSVKLIVNSVALPRERINVSSSYIGKAPEAARYDGGNSMHRRIMRTLFTQIILLN